MEGIGCEQIGTGQIKVLVVNDWLCDTSTWDAARPYLDSSTFSWGFADLRGYGRSRDVDGRFDLEEAAGDVLRLADLLGWETFALVGHSMSTLIALHLAQHYPQRIRRVVVVTPPPPTGFGADERMLSHLQAIALGDDAYRLAALKALWGDRLSDGWILYKASRWRASANPEAAAKYAEMFARKGLPEPTAPISSEVLAITGEEDAPPMRRETVAKLLGPLCPHLTVVPFAQCGHYPMQEMPALLVTTVESFLKGE